MIITCRWGGPPNRPPNGELDWGGWGGSWGGGGGGGGGMRDAPPKVGRGPLGGLGGPPSLLLRGCLGKLGPSLLPAPPPLPAAEAPSAFLPSKLWRVCNVEKCVQVAQKNKVFVIEKKNLFLFLRLFHLLVLKGLLPSNCSSLKVAPFYCSSIISILRNYLISHERWW